MPAFYVTGVKGGTGKSTIARLLIHVLAKQTEPLSVIDCDLSRDIFDSCVTEDGNPKDGIFKVLSYDTNLMRGSQKDKNTYDPSNYVADKDWKSENAVINLPPYEFPEYEDFLEIFNRLNNLTIFFVAENDIISRRYLDIWLKTCRLPFCLILNNRSDNGTEFTLFDDIIDSVPNVRIDFCDMPYLEDVRNNFLLHSEDQKVATSKFDKEWLENSLNAVKKAMKIAAVVNLTDADQNKEEKPARID